MIRDIFSSISDEILGMKWLNRLVGRMIESIFGKEFASGRWGESLQFFIYDFIQISVILCLVIFIISYIQSYFPPERTKKILGKFKGITANIIGALLGTITPFCACSSVPIFIGFTSAGLSSGVTFSFLISSPLVDLGAFILITSIFGIEIAIIYVVVGLLLAVIGGTIIEKTGLGNHIDETILSTEIEDIEPEELIQKERLSFAKDEMFSTYKKVFWYVIVGIIIGALIHNWIPESWIQSVLGSNNSFAVPLATLVGAPIYADIFGTLPIAEALFAKGVGLGTILALMMSVVTLSIPSLLMLKRVVKTKLFVWFIIITMVGIITIGYLFNFINFSFI